MNPEFRRQLWLEINPARVLTLVIALGALFALMRVIDAQTGFSAATPMAAMIAFIVLAVAWGGQRAGESLLEELRARTWDTQRLSALSPWAMTWGKWCGATSSLWLGGAGCLAVFLLTAHHLPPPMRTLLALQAVGGALLVQGTSLIGALALAGHPRRRKGLFGAKLIAVAGGGAYAWLIFRLGASDHLRWYGHLYPALEFCTGLLWCALGWVVVGAYRMMRQELQVPGAPWAWGGFLFSLTFVATGWYVDPGQPPIVCARLVAAVALAVCLLAAYVAAFTLHRDPLVVRRLRHYASARQWRRVAEEIPLWGVALGAALMIGALCVGLAGAGGSPAHPLENLGLSALVLWGFAARDLLLLLGVSCGVREERAEMTAVICYALLYWVLPALSGASGFSRLRAAFRPPLWERPGISLLIVSAQLLICGAWTWRVYRMRIAPQPPNN